MDPQSHQLPDLSVSPVSTPGSVALAQPTQPSFGSQPGVAARTVPTDSIHQAPAQEVTAAPADEQSDDLDQDWVNKAKAIVEKTKLDPYLESKELGKVKAEYLKIRYNKDLKVIEDNS